MFIIIYVVRAAASLKSERGEAVKVCEHLFNSNLRILHLSQHYYVGTGFITRLTLHAISGSGVTVNLRVDSQTSWGAM